jgi:uncharacterized protein (DUF1501 family)
MSSNAKERFMSTTHISRRSFLKQGGALTSAAAVGMPFVMNLVASSSAQAAAAGTYKALVCVFLAGGNDAHNTVIRTDKGLTRFMAARPTVGAEVTSTDTAGTITPLNALDMSKAPNQTGIQSLSLALHPSLVHLKDYFEAGRLAIIGNIGPLAAATTLTTYQNASVALPPKLFSHNDQTSMWQSGQPEGAVSGWGGELVRRFAEQNQVSGISNAQMFSAVGLESTPVFCAGTNAKMPDSKPVVVPFGAATSGGALRPGGLTRDENIHPPGPWLIDWSSPREDVLPAIFSGAAGRGETSKVGVQANNLLETDYLTKLNNANEAWKAISQATATATTSAPPDDNALAAQLAEVAQLIKASGNSPLALGRQVFFVQLGGFDTHSGQIGTNSAHRNLLRKLDEALKYFDDELGDTDRGKVVTFTASEFGRKLNENGDGTDHGWGSHHFVMGGGTKGGVYGHFPDLSTWDTTKSSYADGQLLADGTMIPKVPVDLFAKELGKWLGIDWAVGSNVTVAAQLFPNLSATQALLGFTA